MLKSADWTTRAPFRAAALLAGPALTLALAFGCSAGGTSGDEGTVDLVKAKEAAANSTNEAIAKKAKFAGGLGQPAQGKK
jgi:hypothetical protein